MTRNREERTKTQSSEIIKPMATPRGLETQWSRLETMKDLMLRLLWAKLKPRLGGGEGLDWADYE